MTEVARGVRQLPALIPHFINRWLLRTEAGDVLVDAGTRWDTGGLLASLRGARLAMVALTHVHPDHQGAAHEVCARRGVPLACHEADADVMEGTRPMGPRNLLSRFAQRAWSGPPHPVAIRWKGGERIGEWEVIHAPGHTRGHVVFFRWSDGVAVAGDVVRNASLRAGMGTLSETPWAFSENPRLNRVSMRRLLDLEPSLLCLGHGPPTRDLAGFRRLVESLGE
ncbi:MAG: MBL fold metallo-hydrolase [Gemmataceae bacterium]|nr:MBL fold metallo-hydrolase [Gemmataceae bacterium]